MHFLIKAILFAVLTTLCTESALSEEPQTPPKSICETMEGFNDWDFWVGEWKVWTNDEKHTFQGTNSITKHHKNCLIMENWTSAQGGDGSSMHYYDPVEKQWRQLWVAGGYSIDYTGGLDEYGSMVLDGKINYYKQVKMAVCDSFSSSLMQKRINGLSGLTRFMSANRYTPAIVA